MTSYTKVLSEDKMFNECDITFTNLEFLLETAGGLKDEIKFLTKPDNLDSSKHDNLLYNLIEDSELRRKESEEDYAECVELIQELRCHLKNKIAKRIESYERRVTEFKLSTMKEKARMCVCIALDSSKNTTFLLEEKKFLYQDMKILKQSDKYSLL